PGPRPLGALPRRTGVGAADPGAMGRETGLQRMTNVDPANADLAYQAGMAALGTGREPAALEALEAARAFHPRDARLWHVSGLLHRAVGDLAPAIRCCDTAASPWPRHFGIAHLRARVRLAA